MSLAHQSCKNCVYYRPSERKWVFGEAKFFGYCSKYAKDLPFDQGPICTVYLAIGQVTAQIDASMIVSGLIDLARIPRLDLTKIPLGTSGYFLKGQGASDSVYALLSAGDIPSLDASKIASGVACMQN